MQGKKRKILLVAAISCCVLPLVLVGVLVAIYGSGHRHVFRSIYSTNEGYHWFDCVDCDAEKDRAEHAFTNACDPDCNVCGYRRTITHTYDDACDPDCNVCGEIRTEPHNFPENWSTDKTNHWHECAGCTIKKDKAKHTFGEYTQLDEEFHARTCSVCEYVATAAHSFDVAWHYDENDAETGHYHICSVCGAHSAVTEHSFENACDTTCNGNCGYTRTINHDYSSEWSSDDTYHYHECAICHIHDSDVEHSYGQQSDATKHWQECSVCGHKKDESTHTYDSVWHYDENDAETGHYHMCSVCGTHSETQTHTYDNACDTTCNGGCGFDRVTSHVYDNDCDTDCNICGEIRTAPHSFSQDWSSDDTYHYHECAVCGAHEQDITHDFELRSDASQHWQRCKICQFETNYQLHAYDSNWHSVSAMGHYHICKTCSTDGQSVDHNYGDWAAKDETTHSRICSDCQFEETVDHHYVEGKCSDCDCIQTTQGLAYTYNSSTQTYTVTGIGTTTAKYIKIPSTYDNGTNGSHSVASVGYEAFKSQSNLKEIILPDTITSIGSFAFYECYTLGSLTIPASVTSIGSYAFYKCGVLTKVNYLGTIDQWVQINFNNYSSNPIYYAKALYIEDQLVTEVNLTTATKISAYAFYNCKYITSVTIGNSITSIGGSAFSYCSGLTSITIPNSVTSIGYEAFYYCSGLTSITIPDSVTSIGNNAFEYCSGLTSITIPASVTSMGDNPFEACNLTSITVEEGNTKYCVKGDCLIEIETGRLVTGLNTSVIPTDGSVTSIGNEAFYYCSGLTSITIPDSVTSIGNYAFYNCSGLTSVYYTGTAAEWADITIGSYNSSLTDATRYYYIENEADVPNDGGNYWHYDAEGNIAVW